MKMSQNSNELTERQKNFLYQFIKLKNVQEAAVVAGFPLKSAYRDGMKILRHPKALPFIEDSLAILNEFSGDIVRAGLERLVTGRINDAVALAFSEDGINGDDIQKLDLYNISELKRPKGGGCEIKFFDRQKAAESLYQLNNSVKTGDTAQSFFEALKESAEAEFSLAEPAAGDIRTEEL
jgi:hypothetical protein